MCHLLPSVEGVWKHVCVTAAVRACRELKRMALCPNWCVFQEERGGPVGCQETKFEFCSCYPVLCVSCPCLRPSVSSPGAIFLFASIGYALGDLLTVFLLNFYVDTNSSPAPAFLAVICRSCCCDCQDAAAVIEHPLLHTAASCSVALCVFTIRYGSMLLSVSFVLTVWPSQCILVFPCTRPLISLYLISEPFAWFFSFTISFYILW